MADDPTQFQEFAADDNDDVPWADPAIRVGYEAALGRSSSDLTNWTTTSRN